MIKNLEHLLRPPRSLHVRRRMGECGALIDIVIKPYCCAFFGGDPLDLLH
jgi:hypothetical protein